MGMSGKAFVRSLFLTIVVSFFVAVASFAQKKKRYHMVVIPLLCTLSGVRTLDPLIKSQLLYQLS